MKPFESFLAPEFEAFISWRRGLGLKNSNFQALLRSFDRYVLDNKAGWHDFTPAFFLNFQSTLSGQNRTINIYLSAVHAFFKYLVRREVVAVNPLQDIPARPENRFVPFLFFQEEVDQLLLRAQQRIRQNEQYFFRDYTVATALMLLARCGLRISEPLRLTVHSYRPDEGTIYIRKTKFHKDRLVPLPIAATRELDNHLTVRSRFMDDQHRHKNKKPSPKGPVLQ